MGNGAKVGIAAGVVAILLLFAFLTFNPFVSINSNERGLLFTWGAIDEKVIGQGLTTKTPIAQDIKIVSMLPRELDANIPVGAGGAVTKDLQTVGAHAKIFYRYKEDQLVHLWKDIGEEKMANTVAAIFTADLKSEIGRYEIYDLPTNQTKIQNDVRARITANLASYPVEVTDFMLTNFDWSDDFDAQIKTTMQRKQQVIQAQQDLQITEQNAQKQVKEANAQKEAAIAKAEAEKQQVILEAQANMEAARLNAQAKVLEGEGLRKYNQSLAATWDIERQKKELEIRLIEAQRFDGRRVSEVKVITPMGGAIAGEDVSTKK